MVYVDASISCLKNKKWKYDKSCHLFADTVDELNLFAQSIRLKLEWFQNHTYFPHYDLTEGKRIVAVKHGAKEVDKRFVADFIKALKGE